MWRAQSIGKRRSITVRQAQCPRWAPADVSSECTWSATSDGPGYTTRPPWQPAVQRSKQAKWQIPNRNRDSPVWKPGKDPLEQEKELFVGCVQSNGELVKELDVGLAPLDGNGKRWYPERAHAPPHYPGQARRNTVTPRWSAQPGAVSGEERSSFYWSPRERMIEREPEQFRQCQSICQDIPEWEPGSASAGPSVARYRPGGRRAAEEWVDLDGRVTPVEVRIEREMEDLRLREHELRSQRAAMGIRYDPIGLAQFSSPVSISECSAGDGGINDDTQCRPDSISSRTRDYAEIRKDQPPSRATSFRASNGRASSEYDTSSRPGSRTLQRIGSRTAWHFPPKSPALSTGYTNKSFLHCRSPKITE